MSATQQITRITGRAIPLLADDIDTDRIIPARFLKCVTFEGLGEHAFEDDRGQDPRHPFNEAKYRGATILIAGRNFGCGSSREHAPQALMRWGIKAVVGESFAEIFFGNCTANGVPAVCAERGDLKRLAEAVTADPQAQVTVDLENSQVTCGSLKFKLAMQEGARQALVTGNWDFLGQLVSAAPQIRQTAERLPYMRNFA
ncbi:MAG: 3-isopropylmalate dehydratase small subunit [Planctomycetaceae bacterium]